MVDGRAAQPRFQGWEMISKDDYLYFLTQPVAATKLDFSLVSVA